MLRAVRHLESNSTDSYINSSQISLREESMKKTLLFGLAAALIIVGGLVVAQEAEKKAEAEMPPMGAPEEMKHLAFLVGDWKVASKWRMDYKSEEWTESEATCNYAYILDGCAMQFTYKGDIQGMPFMGMGVQTYDRETKKWQTTWLDNMAARSTLYTGDRKEGTTVFYGDDIYAGMKMMSRMTTWDETETSFKWKMEQSMDGGKTWMVGGEATYTKL